MKFLVALTSFAAIATTTACMIQEHTLDNGFVASFNAKTCKFKLEKYTDC
jgi:hypothetical protein